MTDHDNMLVTKYILAFSFHILCTRQISHICDIYQLSFLLDWSLSTQETQTTQKDTIFFIK